MLFLLKKIKKPSKLTVQNGIGESETLIMVIIWSRINFMNDVCVSLAYHHDM